MFKILGGSVVDGNITGIDPAQLESTNGRVAYATAAGSIQFYFVAEVQGAGGVQLASGNYLNPINLGQNNHALLTGLLADAHPASAISTSSGMSLQEYIDLDRAIVLTGGNFDLRTPVGLPTGTQVTFVRAKGVTDAQVTSQASDFITDAGEFTTITIGSDRGMIATVNNERWEV